MMKNVLLLVLAFLVYRWLRKSGLFDRSRPPVSSNIPTTEETVQCVTCGVYLLRSEALVHNNQFYCCAEHQ